KRFGTITPDKLVIEPLPTLKTALDGLARGASGDASFAFGTGSAEQRGVVTRLVNKPWGYVLAVPLTTYTRAADNATFDAGLMLGMGVLLSFVIGIPLTRAPRDGRQREHRRAHPHPPAGRARPRRCREGHGQQESRRVRPGARAAGPPHHREGRERPPPRERRGREALRKRTVRQAETA